MEAIIAVLISQLPNTPPTLYTKNTRIFQFRKQNKKEQFLICSGAVSVNCSEKTHEGQNGGTFNSQ